MTRTVVVARAGDQSLIELCRGFDVDVVTPAAVRPRYEGVGAIGAAAHRGRAMHRRRTTPGYWRPPICRDSPRRRSTKYCGRMTPMLRRPWSPPLTAGAAIPCCCRGTRWRLSSASDATRASMPFVAGMGCGRLRGRTRRFWKTSTRRRSWLDSDSFAISTLRSPAVNSL